MFLVGCKQSQYQAANAPVSITKRLATATECGNGGTVVRINNVDVVTCNGSVGSTGASGPAGTSVTVIQLCNGVTAYPGTFVEVALLVGNKLYAVYSQNGGFLTYLPPGQYSSNGIGSACNFTVNSNNTISH